MSKSDDDPGVYSLLKRHEDQVVYRVPDPTGETPAWIRIGLYPWQLDGMALGEVLGRWAAGDNRPPSVDHVDGIGLRIGFNGPTTAHPDPRGYRDRIGSNYTVFSDGGSADGTTFRIQNADPAALRQTARWMCVFGFAYWWWLERHTDYPLGKRGTTSEMRSPHLQTVTEDGTVVERDGTTYESPVSLEDIEFRSPEDWKTPRERAIGTIEETVDALREQVPTSTLAQACREVGDTVVDVPEPTERKAQTDQLKSALSGADGVGWQLRNRLVREFETVTDLCGDIRTGGERLRSIRGIGDQTEQAVIDALVENGEWVPEEEADND